MTNSQIRSCEQIALDVIKANGAVFAKEAPLSFAKEVKGIRAIFDEVLYCSNPCMCVCVCVGLN